MNVKNIPLSGMISPWVESLKYLGSILESNNSMNQDILLKRGIMISTVNNLLQEFYYSSLKVLIKLVLSYASSVYGSSLWPLYSKNCDKLFKSWNVMIRKIYNLDRRTHKNLIEPISETRHLKIMLLTRFKKFHECLVESPKFEVRFLARLNEKDNRTVLGHNLKQTSQECNTEQKDLTIEKIRSTQYIPQQVDNLWRENLVKELIHCQQDDMIIDGFTRNEISKMLNFAWIS